MRTTDKFFTRRQQPEQAAIDPVVMRFLTLGGATVTVTDSPARFYARCQGCNWTNYGCGTVTRARDDANEHAGECRAMPKPEVSR